MSQDLCAKKRRSIVRRVENAASTCEGSKVHVWFVVGVRHWRSNYEIRFFNGNFIMLSIGLNLKVGEVSDEKTCSWPE
jgi:hypothetical protein